MFLQKKSHTDGTLLLLLLLSRTSSSSSAKRRSHTVKKYFNGRRRVTNLLFTHTSTCFSIRLSCIGIHNLPSYTSTSLHTYSYPLKHIYIHLQGCECIGGLAAQSKDVYTPGMTDDMRACLADDLIRSGDIHV